ncbi:MAG TPA: ubiquinol-cytochrome c reductase iron-sulfur subunit [Actinomycetota bacterium]
MVGIAQSTFAIILVAVLFGLFVLLLLGSFARSRRAAQTLAVTGEGARPAVPTAATRGPRAKPVMSRRDFFRGGLLASLGIFAAQFGGATIAFLWPNLKGGFGSTITLTDSPEAILGQITSQRQPFYFGAGRFYLIDYTGNGDKPGGVYDGLTAQVAGSALMALYQKCAHLGCRVPFCQQSQWFECPCHGSKYNYAGEYQLGPAPNGLQRFPVKIEGGQLKVDTGNPTAGPPRGTDTIHQSPEGPFCVGTA